MAAIPHARPVTSWFRRHFDLVSEIDDVKTEGSTKGEGALQLGLKVVPTLFILDKNHRLVAAHVGYDTSEHLIPIYQNGSIH